MRRFCFAVVLALLAIVAVIAVQPVQAQSFNFPSGGFTSTNVCANSPAPAESCQVLTNGSPNRPQVTAGGVLRLVTPTTNQHGSAWFKLQEPLATGFTTAFQFQISGTGACANCPFPGDGIALVIQNDPAGTGALGYTGNGQNMAYGNNDVSTASGPGAAIRNSLAIELDTYKNTDYHDPDANHVAVQSCAPLNGNLTPNSADHGYLCPNGVSSNLALQSLPSGLSLSDGGIHTLTVNYLPPGDCTSSCNNLSVYFDSTLILQTTVDITTQLSLASGTSAYLGFTAATGAAVENSDILSWSYSAWPLAPITIVEPVQPTFTSFNFTSNLNETTDYSQSGLPASAFQGLFMQATAQAITDQQFADLVNNTPFQGSTCQHQDTGTGNYVCVTITDLCTTSTNSTPAGANCLSTGTSPLIGITNTYNLDPQQKPIIAPGYIMGKDDALNCSAASDNTCKGLISIFQSIDGDAVTSKTRTNNFNSILVPILGTVAPQTSVTTTPPLNGGWTNGPVSVNFNSVDVVPSNNTNPPSSLPTVTSIDYSATGDNLPSPASGTIDGTTGSIHLPGAAEGATLLTYSATDSSKMVETITHNDGINVTTSLPTFTVKFDLTAPTLSCTAPAAAWQAADAVVQCNASDNANGSGLVGPAAFSVQTNVPAGTETNNATIPPVTVNDVAGNTSAPQPAEGSFGPFQVDKKTPAITGPTISPASPVFGQSVTANYECSDGGSGVVLCGPTGSPQIPATGDTGSLSSPADSTVGTHTFSVNAQDAVGNSSATSSVTYTVNKATPVITWATPAPIVAGTPLSATQLNATANVPGTFVYAPPAGTVLAAGNQTLKVTFTPTDAVNYSSATASVTIVVTQAQGQISLSPTSLNFSKVICGKAASQVETVTNVGNVKVTISKVAVVPGAGSGKYDFKVTNKCSTLAPGAKCSILVSFSSQVVGVHNATLVITDNATGSPQSVPMTATVAKH